MSHLTLMLLPKSSKLTTQLSLIQSKIEFIKIEMKRTDQEIRGVKEEVFEVQKEVGDIKHTADNQESVENAIGKSTDLDNEGQSK